MGLASSSLRKGSKACCAKGCHLTGKITPDRLWINIQMFEYITEYKGQREDDFVVKFQTMT